MPDCVGGTSNVALIAGADEVAAAFAELDVPRFEAARTRVFGQVPCLGEALTSAGAAAVHRVAAIDAFVAGDELATERAFRSVVAAYPSWRLPSDTVPREHPLRDAFDRAAAAPASPVDPLPVPLDATVSLDGRASLDLPQDRPVVAQWTDAGGRVGWTRFLGAGEPFPEYPVAPDSMREAYLARNIVTYAAPRKPVELVVTSAALAAAAGGLYGAAWSRGQVFRDPTTPYEDLGALRTQTNGLLVGSAVAAAGAVGLGAVAAVRW